MAFNRKPRGEVRNPIVSGPRYQPLIDRAADATLSRLNSTGSTPPTNITTPGEAEDGSVFTVHAFMTELDSTEDPGALTS